MSTSAGPFSPPLSVWWASSLAGLHVFQSVVVPRAFGVRVGLFLWYWHETRQLAHLRQWCVLAAIAGLMLNVYYANAMVLAVLVVEAVGAIQRRVSRASAVCVVRRNFSCVTCVRGVVVVCLLPTLVTRYIIYGAPLRIRLHSRFANGRGRSPLFPQVLFSANHGLLAWTPLAAVFRGWAVPVLEARAPRWASAFLAALLAFYLLIACYPDWAGISSYGNRFFVSLTALFIVGLAFFWTASRRCFALFARRRSQLPRFSRASFCGTWRSCFSGERIWFPLADRFPGAR